MMGGTGTPWITVGIVSLVDAARGIISAWRAL
jgi:hypothetical protein